MKTIAILMVIAALLLVGCTQAPTPADQGTPFPSDAEESDSAVKASGNTNQVTIVGFEFMPRTVEVKAGDAVEWVNVDSVKNDEDNDYNKGVDHTVTFDNGMVDQVIPAGTTFTTTFTEPGVYNYACSFHPGMQGVVVVS